MIQPIDAKCFGVARLALLAAVGLASACANTSPVGEGDAGGSGGGPWSTHGPNGSQTSGKAGATVGNGPGSGTGSPATSGAGGQSPQCGDGVCAPTETCASCEADCGACVGVCGDAVCDPNETCASCAADCGACAVCGDNVCAPTETCASCYQDCGICACVADGFEPNNGSSTSTDAAPATDYCNLSVCAGDVDWIGFTVTSSLSAKITFTDAEGDLDLEIYSAQTLDYVSGSYSHSDSETVTLSGLAPGTYWARIYGYQSATNPSYCFRVDTN